MKPKSERNARLNPARQTGRKKLEKPEPELSAADKPEPKETRVEPAVRDGELLDIAAAVRLLNTSRPTFSRWLKSGRIKGMKIGRQWRFYRADIERFLEGSSPRVDLPISIRPLIDDLSKKFGKAVSEAESITQSDATDVQKAVRLMLLLAVDWDASDIHLSTIIESDSNQPVGTLRFRLDGALNPVATIDRRLMPLIIQELKTMAEMNVAEKMIPQDGRIIAQLKKSGAEVDLRINVTPNIFGEAATIRVLVPDRCWFDLNRIKFTENDLKRVEEAISAPYGLVLFSGPIGSGKTTVLYSATVRVAKPNVKTVSIENPVEYYLPYVNQIQVSEGKGMTFERGISAALRSDPDSLLIGEIRTLDALNLSLTAALSGHLVLSQIHADSAIDALQRLLDMGAEPYRIADAVKLIESQKLVRCLCKACRRPSMPDRQRIDSLKNRLPLKNDWHESVGCDVCHQTGAKGRSVVAETMAVTNRVRKAIKAGESMDTILRIAVEEGMTSIADHGMQLASEGVISLEEALWLE